MSHGLFKNTQFCPNKQWQKMSQLPIKNIIFFVTTDTTDIVPWSYPDVSRL